mmetsp:Transcript_19272/g.46533  ORF Transcript_19272/g.46533 Transcript_19272/m.46533 type:complete len:263 (-) Transcript_19272:505-1293(-)
MRQRPKQQRRSDGPRLARERSRVPPAAPSRRRGRASRHTMSSTLARRRGKTPGRNGKSLSTRTMPAKSVSGTERRSGATVRRSALQRRNLTERSTNAIRGDSSRRTSTMTSSGPRGNGRRSATNGRSKERPTTSIATRRQRRSRYRELRPPRPPSRPAVSVRRSWRMSVRCWPRSRGRRRLSGTGRWSDGGFRRSRRSPRDSGPKRRRGGGLRRRRCGWLWLGASGAAPPSRCGGPSRPPRSWMSSAMTTMSAASSAGNTSR